MTWQATRRQFALIVVLWSTAAHADIYKWVDKDGNIHFGDRAPLDRRAERRESTEPAVPPDPQTSGSEKQQGQSPPSTEQRSSASAEKGPAQSTARVEMYTTSWCGYCKKAREFFRVRGISFTDYDIEKDPAAMARRLAMGSGKSVPVVIINGSVIRGFSPSSFEAALRGR